MSFLREPFTAFADAQADFVRALSTDQPSLITAALVDSHFQRLEQVMTTAWERYSQARQFVYGIEEDSHSELLEMLKAEEEGRKRRESSAVGGSRRPSVHWGEEPLVALQSTTDTLLQHPAAALHPHRTRLHHDTNDIFHRSCFLSHHTYTHTVCHLPPCILSAARADRSLLSGACRVLFSFYLQRYHSALISADFHFPTVAASANHADPPPHTPYHAKRQAVSSSIAHHIHHPLSCSLLGLHPLADAVDLVRALAHFVRHRRVDVDWLKASLKVGLIMCVSSVIAVVPALTSTDVFPNALWCTVRQHSPLSPSQCPASCPLL